MFLPLLAFGAERHKNISILEDAQVNGQTLKPGDYQLRFDDASPNTQVKFVRYGKTVLTAPARVEHQQKQVKSENYVFNDAHGQHNLAQIFVSKDEALVFSNTGIPNSASPTEGNNNPSQ